MALFADSNKIKEIKETMRLEKNEPIYMKVVFLKPK